MSPPKRKILAAGKNLLSRKVGIASNQTGDLDLLVPASSKKKTKKSRIRNPQKHIEKRVGDIAKAQALAALNIIRDQQENDIDFNEMPILPQDMSVPQKEKYYSQEISHD